MMICMLESDSDHRASHQSTQLTNSGKSITACTGRHRQKHQTAKLDKHSDESIFLKITNVPILQVEVQEKKQTSN